jgi:hypothetical protein
LRYFFGFPNFFKDRLPRLGSAKVKTFFIISPNFLEKILEKYFAVDF